MAIKEIWRPVEGFNGSYEVSNSGKVKALRRQISYGNVKKTIPERIICMTIHSGYHCVQLWLNSKLKSFGVHRLVAIAFIPNPENKPCVNHKNGIKTDNRVQNLEWCTHKENMEHASKAGMFEGVKKTKLTKSDVLKIRASNESNKSIAKMYGVYPSYIGEIKNGIKWKKLTFILLIIISSASKAQTVTLPTWVADSLIYEVKLGRQCTQVTASQALEIESLHKELNSYGVALKLSQSSNETLSGLLNNSKESNSIQALQFQKDIQTEKKKVRRWRKVAFIQTLGIVGLVILML